jgi:hypothetical protein
MLSALLSVSRGSGEFTVITVAIKILQCNDHVTLSCVELGKDGAV